MKSYEWMVEYTPQTRWIGGHGVLVWLAEVFGMLGGGLYLVSLYFESMSGMFVGWLIIVVLKGGFHLVHLGQPSRFWRLFLKSGSSWLARGLVFVALFILFGGVQLLSSQWFPGTAWEVLFKVLAGTMALLVAAYSGFVMNSVNGIPFWNSALLPLLFIAFGIVGGLAVMLLIGAFQHDADLMMALRLIPILLPVSALLAALHLWTATYMGPAAKRSVMELILGTLALPLWLGVVLCGMVIPAGITLYIYLADSATRSLFVMMTVAILIGVFSFNYCLLKGALYRPLIPKLP